jgi:formylglycine-generating enzyme required for sulfatase activity
MGSRELDRYPDERPRHWVEISQGFWLARTPTTLAQFQRYGAENRKLSTEKVPDDPRHPAIGVNWLDASEYCQWLTDKVVSQQKDWKTFRARLPTEAEWERACRGPDGDSLVETEYWSGDGETALAQVGWFFSNSTQRLHPVGLKPANAWGLCDMHGLVWEWCQDLWNDQAYLECGFEVIDPVHDDAALQNVEDAQRVLRGGSWFFSAAFCRSAVRIGSGAAVRIRAGYGSVTFGFRVALVPGPCRAQSKSKKQQKAGSAHGTRRRREASSRPKS